MTGSPRKGAELRSGLWSTDERATRRRHHDERRLSVDDNPLVSGGDTNETQPDLEDAGRPPRRRRRPLRKGGPASALVVLALAGEELLELVGELVAAGQLVVAGEQRLG